MGRIYLICLLDLQAFHGHPEMLVFVDETEADKRTCLRYSPRIKHAVSNKLLVCDVSM